MPFCPECRAEYLPGHDACAECQTVLKLVVGEETTVAVCPACNTEYGYPPATDTCPACPVPLVDELPPEPDWDLVEVYAAVALMEAQLICGTLEDSDVEASVLDRRDRAFPTPGRAGRVRVAVREGKEAQAREVIEGARKDGAISDGGAFLDS